MSEMITKERTKLIIISFIVIGLIGIVGYVILENQSSQIYDFLKQDCESNGGVLWTYSGCQKTPFTKSNCEFDGGFVCHLSNGTKYQRELNFNN